MAVLTEHRQDEEFRQRVVALTREEFKEKVLKEEDPYFKDVLLYHRGTEHLAEFCKIFLPHYCTLPFSQLHLDTFSDYEYGKRGQRSATAAPRGYSKSTNKAFIKPVHDICYNLETYILIASNTEDQAKQKLKDIRDELLQNKDIRRVYGDFFPGRPAALEFVCESDGNQIKVQAVSSKKEIRGYRFGASRPSKIVIDDFEHSQEVESEDLRDKYMRTYSEVFSKLGTKKTNIDVVGTVLHQDSMLKKIIKNPTYDARVYKAISAWSKRKDLWGKWEEIFTDVDNINHREEANAFYEEHKKEMLEDTEVLWPEHESYLDLQIEIISDGIRVFMKEKQNDPMSSDENVFNPQKVRYFVDCGEYIEICGSGVKIYKSMMECYGVIDPSTGQTKGRAGKKGSYSCILVGYKDHLGRVFVIFDYTMRVPPSKFIEVIFDLHELYDFKQFGVEENLFKNLLSENIRKEQDARNVVLSPKDKVKLKIKSIHQVENKEKRIYSVEPKVNYGEILFEKNNISDIFWNQLWNFPKADHDDCPDALEMLWAICNRAYGVGGVKTNKVM